MTTDDAVNEIIKQRLAMLAAAQGDGRGTAFRNRKLNGRIKDQF